MEVLDVSINIWSNGIHCFMNAISLEIMLPIIVFGSGIMQQLDMNIVLSKITIASIAFMLQNQQL